jgi:bifunctional non-homologous end joining protein LigD
MFKGFKKLHSSEPAGQRRSDSDHLRFMVHCQECKEKGDLLFGFTLELNGIKTWAIDEGPSMNPLEQRKAREDKAEHIRVDIRSEEYDPLAWDKGNYIPIDDNGNVLSEYEAIQSLKEGLLKFFVQGKKLVGEFVLMRQGKSSWLLIKRHDEFALYNSYDLAALAQ